MAAQYARMRKAIDACVLPVLRAKGFTGDYPQLRRESPGKIDLLAFQASKHGDAFSVEGAVIFPDAKTREMRNYHLTRPDQLLTEVDEYSTFVRRRLQGMYNGQFFFADVYAEPLMRSPHVRIGTAYIGVSEEKRGSFQPTPRQKIVQRADEQTPERVAQEVVLQLRGLLRWFDRIQSPARLLRYARWRSLRDWLRI